MLKHAHNLLLVFLEPSILPNKILFFSCLLSEPPVAAAVVIVTVAAAFAAVAVAVAVAVIDKRQTDGEPVLDGVLVPVPEAPMDREAV